MQSFFGERGEEFDFVMISRHYVASRYLGLLRRYCPKARFLFDTVDLHYLREERLARLEGSLALERAAAQTRRSELAVIEAADATLVGFSSCGRGGCAPGPAPGRCGRRFV